jgi:hypothetical protein
MRIIYRLGTVNIVADTLLQKQEVLKTQKEKDVAVCTMYLINPALIIATLEVTPEDPLVIVNREWEPYELVN